MGNAGTNLLRIDVNNNEIPKDCKEKKSAILNRKLFASDSVRWQGKWKEIESERNPLERGFVPSDAMLDRRIEKHDLSNFGNNLQITFSLGSKKEVAGILYAGEICDSGKQGVSRMVMQTRLLPGEGKVEPERGMSIGRQGRWLEENHRGKVQFALAQVSGETHRTADGRHQLYGQVGVFPAAPDAVRGLDP